MYFRVTLDARISPGPGTDRSDGITDDAFTDATRDALDGAMAELLKLKTIDPAVHLDYRGGGRLAISCVVDVAEVEEAVPPASSNVRTALHAAGIGTSRWPHATDPRWKVDLIGAQTEIMEPVGATAD